MTAKAKHVLNFDALNPNVKLLQYAVRGPLFVRAKELEKELEKGVKKPFTEVIKANYGDCHAMGQVPITFIRQILALVTYPPLFDDPRFPEDVKRRAKLILSVCAGGSVGSYSDTPGIELIRKHVAEYIKKRDGGIESDWQDIYLSAGAGDAIRKALRLFICEENEKRAGILVPIPQYPIYSAVAAEYNLKEVGYYLDESQEWGLNMDEMQRAVDEARKVCHPRILVVITPGNPTGQVLSRKNIEEIIKFAYKAHLFIFADEVYQDNVYAEGSQFHSFKKVLFEMGEPYSNMELASFMSCSKGYMGECGLRCGYGEIVNMCPEVKAMHYKAISAIACPSIVGQACLDAIVWPPQKGEPSYETFIKEKKAVMDSLKVRAKMVVDGFNSFEGFSCNDVQGAMYAFPRFELPPKAIEAAKKVNQLPDVFYAFQLLESTGICVVPGSGFGQQPGTYHFRTTILPQPEKLKLMLEKFQVFHKEFLNKYK